MNKKLSMLLLTPLLAVGMLSTGPMKADASATEGLIIKSVNFRDQPSLSADQIRYLKQGETVRILDDSNKYWYKVADQSGKVGFVTTLSQYVKVTAESSTASTSNATVAAGVNMRSGASTAASVIRMLRSGEQVEILQKVNNWWYQVRDSQGQTGYASTASKYWSITGSISDSSSGSAGSGTSGSTQSDSSNSGTVDTSALAQKVIDAGMKYWGTPYEYGSSRSNTSTFDCSDFVRQAFIDGAGITLPADSRQQGDYVKAKGSIVTDWRQLKPGDLVFFMSYQGSQASDYAGINKSTQRITHDAIYIGNGKILHTYSKASGGVRTSSIDGTSWEYRMIFGGSAF